MMIDVTPLTDTACFPLSYLLCALCAVPCLSRALVPCFAQDLTFIAVPFWE